MRPFYEIEQMIIAHYNNDDDSFNSFARAVIDYYKKDGNILGAEELEEIMTTGHLEPRTNRPKFLQETTPVYPEKDNSVSDNTNDVSSIETVEEKKNDITESIEDNDIQEKPKRHRRTKAEMLLAKQQEENSVKQDSTVKTKRHRRTKSELIAAGYYNNK